MLRIERQVDSPLQWASALDLTDYCYIFFPLARDIEEMKSPEKLKDTLNLPKQTSPCVQMQVREPYPNEALGREESTR